VDNLNAKVLGIATDKLDEAQAELDDARKELNDATAEMNSGQEKLKEEQASTTKELAEYSKLLDEAIATKAAYAAVLVGLQADETALKAELKAYKDNKIQKN
jgi:predicted nuclease with TOPRIM domain